MATSLNSNENKSADELLTKQQFCATEIERLLSNYKKKGKNKTKPYVEEQKAKIISLWEEFDKNDTLLLDLLSEQDDYFQAGVRGKTREYFDTALGLMDKYLQEQGDAKTDEKAGDEIQNLLEDASSILANPRSVKPTETIISNQGTSVPMTSPYHPTQNQMGAQQMPQGFGGFGGTHFGVHPMQQQMGGQQFPQGSAGAHHGMHPGMYYYMPYPPTEQRNEGFQGWQQSPQRPRLPPIRINKFNGNPKEWKAFYEVFMHIFDKDHSLHDTEKLTYLLSYLEGDAKRVVSHLTPTAENYRAALNLLKNRFDNKRDVSFAHINSLLDMKKMEFRNPKDVINMHDSLNESIAGLQSLGYQTDQWDLLIMGICLRKLDQETSRLFEESLADPADVPKVSELTLFLRKRHRVLTTGPTAVDSYRKKETKNNKEKDTQKKNFHSTSTRISCFLCKEAHALAKCPKFVEMSSYNKRQSAIKLELCLLCLSHKKEKQCTSKKNCATCGKAHHTLLHFDKKPNETAKNNTSLVSATEEEEEEAENHVSLVTSPKIKSPLFLTAMVKVKALAGDWQLLRALIDTGSGDSFITEAAAQDLAVPREKIHAPISGIGDKAATVAKHQVQLEIAPRFSSTFKLTTTALVLKALTGILPHKDLSNVEYVGPNIDNLLVADPTFLSPGPIDLILGSEVYANILKAGIKKSNNITAQNTQLGWLMSGAHPSKPQEYKVTSLITMAELDEKLAEFWEMDETPEEQANEHPCEEHFARTHARKEDGRYVVHLPFKEDPAKLGLSRGQAIARLKAMEKKFANNSELYQNYKDFMNEYIELGHMSPVENNSGLFYLPHHAVFKEESSTTKQRTVFDGSAKTTTGYSFNSILHAGPKIQDDLSDILTRWRKYKYVFTADIEKMFRQIEVAIPERVFQIIFWRDDPSKPMQEYTLNTVTYGTASATYLAVRVLLQLAIDEGMDFPRAAAAVRDFYVDDLMTGAHTKEEALELQAQMIALLAKGGMNLRKWTSNCPELLGSLETKQIEAKYLENDRIKTLGLEYDSMEDCFQFSIKLPPEGKVTKRIILSVVASIFDPAGFLAPVILRAKLIIQKIWMQKQGWDDQIPREIHHEWEKFLSALPEIEKIRINRYINYSPGAVVQIHGFADASEKAYGAVVYARITHKNKTTISLLEAKTRVAPLKKKQSMPRMELNAGELLAKLMNKVVKSLKIPDIKVYAWLDSQVALAWIAKDPSTWEVYVANRVASIHSYFDRSIWSYVNTLENPADLASRGICPSKLEKERLWWLGPNWLIKNKEYWPNAHDEDKRMWEEELRKLCPTTSSLITMPHWTSFRDTEEILEEQRVEVEKPPENDLLRRFNTFSMTKRVLARCFRFKNACKKVTMPNFLTAKELEHAEKWILRTLQNQHFTKDIKRLSMGLGLTTNSSLLSLNPFLDKDGLLRVGGRLENSELPYNAKHQILLPQKSHITRLIIQEAHMTTLHGGNSLTLYQTRYKYWIINPGRVIKDVIYECMPCFRSRKHKPTQLMADLPPERVQPSPPFTVCGVDYAGPFLTRTSKGRGIRTTKSYIAVFVCFSTKMVHLELVSDLTTAAFIAALTRFTARRGTPRKICSDNGTNFVGAKRYLDKDVIQAIRNAREEAAEYTATKGIEWEFIPPAAPHFGGLWEAAVKSTKKHLKIALNGTSLTYEEFTTVLARVEAALNSRPISPLSNRPDDLSALSPAMFYSLKPLLAPPEQEVTEKNPVRRWKLVNKLHQTLWKRWTKEYLQTLQQRYKWKQKQDPIKEGDLVLIISEQTPPLEWPLARVTEIHVGSQGLPRSVTLKTKGGIKCRPITKLAKLPHQFREEDESEDDEPPADDNQGDHDAEMDESNVEEVTPMDESEDEPQPTTSNTSRRRDKSHSSGRTTSWKSTILFMLVALFSLGLAGEVHNYSIVKPEPGLYVEKMGNVWIKRGVLRIQVDYPYEQLDNDKTAATQIVDEVTDACKGVAQYTSDVNCSTVLNHLQHMAVRLKEQIDIIQGIGNRRKRGLLGKAMTYIFGVNDEVYEEINNLKQQRKEETTVVQKNNMLLNAKIDQAIEGIQVRFRRYNKKINEITKLTNEMQQWHHITDHNRVRLEILSMIMSAEGYLEELTRLYENLASAKLGYGILKNFVNQDKIRIAIDNTLRKIGHSFTVTLSNNEVDYAEDDHNIKIFGKLSILETSVYERLHLTPIPSQLSNGSYLLPSISADDLAVNYNEQKYFTPGKEECTTKHKGSQLEYTCAPHATHSIKEKPLCEIDEIYNRHPKRQCEVITLNVHGIIWKKLAMVNVWLFITERTESIAVICETMRQESIINGAGIIRIPSGCTIETGTMILRATLDQLTGAKMAYIKPLNFSGFMNSKQPQVIKGHQIEPLRQDESLAAPALPYAHVPEHFNDTARHPAVTIALSITIILMLGASWKLRHKCVNMIKTKRQERDRGGCEEMTLTERFGRMMKRRQRKAAKTTKMVNENNI